MARIGSRQIAGYYPTPEHLLDPIASILDFSIDVSVPVLFDPVAGDGAAITGLRDRWLPNAQIVAAELEAQRAAALKRRLAHYPHQALHADALTLAPNRHTSPRATVLYLNPPYDTDPQHRRLEQRFLANFTPFLCPGAGHLLFVIPHRALAASAEYLATHYQDLEGFRFPDEDFEAFGQIVVHGRRAEAPLTDAPMRGTLLRWADHPNLLDTLSPRGPSFTVSSDHLYQLALHARPLDVGRAVESFQPWTGTTNDPLPSVDDLLGGTYQTALPPKPAHIALALTSGMFNGRRIEPNDPSRHPALLAKGVYTREFVEVDTKHNKDGDLTGVVEIECPRLQLTVLRLDTFEFHELAAGVEPSGSDDPAEWTPADLLLHYDRGLAGLLAKQFPPIHDPLDPDQALPLPVLDRTPFPGQVPVLNAALKLFALGRNPVLQAETATGKTTLGLFLHAALSSRHHATLSAALSHLGYERGVRKVRRTLVVCPPHLLDTWTGEAAAVDASLRVRIVHCASDLDDPDAEVFVLSRERAKLGHGYRGVDTRCPRCGAEITRSARLNASGRHRCRAKRRIPTNAEARLTQELARLLVPLAPDNDLVRNYAYGAILERRANSPASKDASLARRAARTLLTLVLWEYRRTVLHAPEDEFSYNLHYSLPTFYVLAGQPLSARAALEALAADPRCSDSSRVRQTIAHLDRAVSSTSSTDLTAGRSSASCSDLVEALTSRLEKLAREATWDSGSVCGEPLFQAEPPCRIPLANVISRRYKRRFQLLLLDEAHEYNHASSAQSKSAQRLISLPGVPTVLLTGSLMGGFASSLFTLFWATSSAFRSEFQREDRTAFSRRYGYLKTLREVGASPNAQRRYGAHSDTETSRRIVGEAPGIRPSFILRHLLPTSLPLHVKDLGIHVPEPVFESLPLEPEPEHPLDQELLHEYQTRRDDLVDIVRRDCFDPERSGKMLGALMHFRSYLDRATDDLPPFEVREPASLSGSLLWACRAFPATYRTPKERAFLGLVQGRLDAGEKILVFVEHTRSGLPKRLQSILGEVDVSAKILDTVRVSTAKRRAWIDRHVIDQGVRVLIVNPEAVKTGLNNLIAFSTAVWYEMTHSAFTFRQAVGRLPRPGQTRQPYILMPYYSGTSQEIAHRHVARKVEASLQTDGFDIRAALEAAGASNEHTQAIASAMSLGQAIYRQLTGG